MHIFSISKISGHSKRLGAYLLLPAPLGGATHEPPVNKLVKYSYLKRTISHNMKMHKFGISKYCYSNNIVIQTILESLTDLDYGGYVSVVCTTIGSLVTTSTICTVSIYVFFPCDIVALPNK